MAETKHTPGPWTAHDGSIWSTFPSDSKDRYLAEVYPCEREAHHERDANACLMAAAPELLDALDSLLHAAIEVGELPPDFGATRKSRQALAKARGGACPVLPAYDPTTRRPPAATNVKVPS